MNIILISDDRLKVTLTDSDLVGYGIRIEDIDYDNTETRRVFWSILDKAKIETGFDAAVSRIFIQIYPDSHGGCDMYVSKIGDRRSARKSDSPVKCKIGNIQEEKKAEYIYRFSCADHLISACRALKYMGFLGSSSAYVEDDSANSNYYLILKAEAKWLLFLSEYGEKRSDRYGKCWITERCRQICIGNATEILGNL